MSEVLYRSAWPESALLSLWGPSWCNGEVSVEVVKSCSSASVEGIAPETVEEVWGFIPLAEITVDYEIMSSFGKSSTHVRAYKTACPFNSSLDSDLGDREFRCNIIVITEVPFDV